MSRDILLYGAGSSEWQHGLERWQELTPGLHDMLPDPHRLQLERWLWERLTTFPQGTSVLDVGQHETPRRWVGDGYFTFGLSHQSDVVGTLLNMPFPDGSLDVVVCAEVLEHCTDPFVAGREIHRVLKPGGHLFASAPFIWPIHSTQDYPDFWRFTDEGWHLLLCDFSEVNCHPTKWSEEGESLYELLRRFECMGHRDETRATTGFNVEAVK